MTARHPLTRPATRRAFSLVELMIVIAILGLLVSIGVFVGSRVLYEQKVSQARATMQILTSVAEDFARVDPLRNKNRGATMETHFGGHPPYSLDDTVDFDDDNNRDFFADIRVVFHFYLANRQGSINNYVSELDPEPDANLDLWISILNFYGLTRQFAPDLLDTIPEDIVVDPPVEQPFLIEPDGRLGDSDEQAVDVQAIVDPWGVPYQYLVYAKLEPELDIGSGTSDPVWKVTEVIPVFMSYGAEPEKLAQALADPDRWIWSEDLPRPRANIDADGDLPSNATHDDAGWVRLRAFQAPYGFLPEQDGL
jgi:prepilin-type N-terminal cleavage/methylation domain-containing protein